MSPDRPPRRRARRRTIALLVGTAALATTSCSPDPPSAAVGLLVEGCRNRTGRGSGMFVQVDGVDEPLLLTSAHVVKGATTITVVRGDETASARIAAFDPEMDLAYLEVDGMRAAHPGTVDSDGVEAGDDGVAHLWRDHAIRPLPVVVRRRVRIDTEDIYVEGETRRPGYELIADIDPGDSGGAVVVDGRVVGVVWARSNRAVDRAYAIDPERAGDLVRRQLRDGRIDDGIDLTRC